MPPARTVSAGASKGNRAPPPRDLSRENYAGARSAITTPNPEWHSSAVEPTDRLEQEYAKAKTKSDARSMVANMVAERLAMCGISVGSVPSVDFGGLDKVSPAPARVSSPAGGSYATPRTPGGILTGQPPPPPPPPPQTQANEADAIAADMMATAASLTNGAGAAAGTTLYRKPAVNAVVNAAVSAAVSAATAPPTAPQPKKVWRHAGAAPPPSKGL